MVAIPGAGSTVYTVPAQPLSCPPLPGQYYGFLNHAGAMCPDRIRPTPGITSGNTLGWSNIGGGYDLHSGDASNFTQHCCPRYASVVGLICQARQDDAREMFLNAQMVSQLLVCKLSDQLRDVANIL